jgi:uncharacterized protein YabE (DUF348 family)
VTEPAPSPAQGRHAAVDAPAAASETGNPEPLGTPDRRFATRMDRKRAERRRGRIIAGATVAGLVVAMTAVGGTLAAMAKTVTIAVDGATQQVTTLSRTVSGALHAAGVRLGKHDTLAPAAGTAIGDGSQIVVQRGRLVTVTIDGTPRQFWTTARTVDAALAQIGRNAADFKLSADRSRPIPLGGLTLTATTLHTVTLTDPSGASVTVTTAAATVGDLLAQHGIDLADDQRVHPDPSTPITDGLTVTVSTLPTVTLVQGSERDQLVSGAGTVAGLLAAQGIALSADTVVSPGLDSALAPGMQVTVTTLPTITITVGAAKAVTVIARRSTVADLLAARDITLGKHDVVRPAAKTRLTDGMQVTVTRIRYTTTSKTVTVPQPADVVTYSDSLEQGSSRVTGGHPGTDRVSYRIKIVNGKPGAPQETGRTVEVQPVATVTVIGTKAPPTTSSAPMTSAAKTAPTTSTASATSSAGSVETVGDRVYFHDYSYGVNWDGLAHCESTNYPRAVDPTGTYFGLFQFDLSTWRSVGGSGNPIDASPQEQLLRAKELYLARGLQPWACAWAAH